MAERLSRELGCAMLGKIPLEPGLSLSGDTGQSLYDIGEESKALASFEQVAKKLDLFFNDCGGLQEFELVWNPDCTVIDTSLKPQSSEKFARIARIFQAGPKEFVIEWTDGGVSRYDLAKLQSQCPCARCQVKNKELIEEISATRVYSAGRFGVKIEFSKGCRAGIYSFAFLRQSYQ